MLNIHVKNSHLKYLMILDSLSDYLIMSITSHTHTHTHTQTHTHTKDTLVIDLHKTRLLCAHKKRNTPIFVYTPSPRLEKLN